MVIGKTPIGITAARGCPKNLWPPAHKTLLNFQNCHNQVKEHRTHRRLHKHIHRPSQLVKLPYRRGADVSKLPAKAGRTAEVSNCPDSWGAESRRGRPRPGRILRLRNCPLRPGKPKREPCNLHPQPLLTRPELSRPGAGAGHRGPWGGGCPGSGFSPGRLRRGQQPAAGRKGRAQRGSGARARAGSEKLPHGAPSLPLSLPPGCPPSPSSSPAKPSPRLRLLWPRHVPEPPEARRLPAAPASSRCPPTRGACQ
ncbi:cuticle collagen 1-like [Octodon degus]|uniref:Cuticle collagen 1-like n=1 Tax=Octodon degus TaxID=10160 RepID=A0A6P6DTW2_OCTDE|nr:cuticle collagen 1-like [Octodon degus]